MGGDASRNGAELFEIEADFSAKIVTFRLVGGMHPPPKSATHVNLIYSDHAFTYEYALVIVRNYIFCFTKLPWPGDSERTFRSLSQATTCPRVVSRVGLGPEVDKISGLIRAGEVLFVLGAQKFN